MKLIRYFQLIRRLINANYIPYSQSMDYNDPFFFLSPSRHTHFVVSITQLILIRIYENVAGHIIFHTHNTHEKKANCSLVDCCCYAQVHNSDEKNSQDNS